MSIESCTSDLTVCAGEILSRTNLKHTPGRIAILEFLLMADKPVTSQEVFESVKHVGVNNVTVYRTLTTLFRQHILHRIDTGDRVWRFAFCGCSHKGHCHPHFVCRMCGKIECINEVGMPNMSLPKTGYVVEEREMYFRGICGKCASA
jgi:Fur family ferric uptake transcriptional regulator